MMSWLSLAGIKQAQNTWTLDIARRAGRRVARGMRRFFSADKALAEGISGMFTFLLAMMLVVAEYRDQEFKSLHLMFELQSGYVWGVVAAIGGVCQLVGRVLDGRLSRDWMRWIGAILAAWIWGMMAYSMLRYDGLTPSWLAVAGMVCADLYISSRILSHAR